MRHYLLILAAAATLAAPAAAAAPKLAAAPAAAVEGRVITKGAAWNCQGATCSAVSDVSRPVVLCERLVKKLGPVASFSVDGKAFDEGKLARCNAKAN